MRRNLLEIAKAEGWTEIVDTGSYYTGINPKTKKKENIPLDLPSVVAARETPEGELILRAGFEPYHTETSGRRIAEHAVKEIAELFSVIDDLDLNGPAWHPDTQSRLDEIRAKHSKS